MKIVKSLEECNILIKGVNETIKTEAEKQNGWISWHVISFIRC